MSNIVVKKSKNINAKFKSLCVQGGRDFVDLETGEIIDLAAVVSQTIGDGESVDVQISNKIEEDITPTSED